MPLVPAATSLSLSVATAAELWRPAVLSRGAMGRCCHIGGVRVSGAGTRPTPARTSPRLPAASTHASRVTRTHRACPGTMWLPTTASPLSVGRAVLCGGAGRTVIVASESAVLLPPAGRISLIHVDDLVSAMLAAFDNPEAARQLFNIAMTDPVDYGAVATYLARSRGLEAVEIKTSFHSNALDNAKARHMLDWRPEYDFQQLIEAAFTYEREPNDPRKVWYVG